MWNNRLLNHITEYVAGTLQGAPLFLFKTVHIDSHHRYNQGQKDATRVARAGEHNHLIGYITYPAFSFGPVRLLRNEYIAVIVFLRCLSKSHHPTRLVVFVVGYSPIYRLATDIDSHHDTATH